MRDRKEVIGGRDGMVSDPIETSRLDIFKGSHKAARNGQCNCALVARRMQTETSREDLYAHCDRHPALFWCPGQEPG